MSSAMMENAVLVSHKGSVHSFEARLVSPRELVLEFEAGDSAANRIVHTDWDVDMILPSVEGNVILVLFGNGKAAYYLTETGESVRDRSRLPPASFYC